MTQSEAVEVLRKAGLHARALDRGDIMGGSFVDRSTNINVVQNSFWVYPVEGGLYRIQFEDVVEGSFTLEAAVELVTSRIPPGQDIEPTPRTPNPNGVEYY